MIFNHRSRRFADDVIVLDLTLMRAEPRSGRQPNRVHDALWASQLDPVARFKDFVHLSSLFILKAARFSMVTSVSEEMILLLGPVGRMMMLVTPIA